MIKLIDRRLEKKERAGDKKRKGENLLGLFDGFRHGEEDAVEQDGRHDDVVKIRMRRQVDGDASQRIPRRKQETRTRS